MFWSANDYYAVRVQTKMSIQKATAEKDINTYSLKEIYFNLYSSTIGLCKNVNKKWGLYNMFNKILLCRFFSK